jgi:hypothetical protein
LNFSIFHPIKIGLKVKDLTMSKLIAAIIAFQKRHLRHSERAAMMPHLNIVAMTPWAGYKRRQPLRPRHAVNQRLQLGGNYRLQICPALRVNRLKERGNLGDN